MASNHSTFGADILTNADHKLESDTGKLKLANAHEREFKDIAEKLKVEGAKVRTVLLSSWAATPVGESFMLAYDDLKADGTSRTKTQEKQFSVMQGRLKAINTTLSRAFDTWRGIATLRELGRTVKVEKPKTPTDVEGADVWLCHVSYDSDKLSEEQRKLEKSEPVLFDATKLARIASVKASITDTMDTITVRKLVSAKATANKKKGGNGVVEPSKVREQVELIDTALSKLLKSDGTGIAGGKGVETAYALLFAKLEAELPEAVKEAGRKEYAAEGADAAA
jgi:hypothetical protein